MGAAGQRHAVDRELLGRQRRFHGKAACIALILCPIRETALTFPSITQAPGRRKRFPAPELFWAGAHGEEQNYEAIHDVTRSRISNRERLPLKFWVGRPLRQSDRLWQSLSASR